MDFDIIPFEDIVWGRRLGAGSFGSVYKGSYLGVDIAIKEVLPSTEYDVHKYFEREWRIMRECRHPNIVLFLGLSKAPGDDGRVFIISEYVPRGNLRQYILSSHPFPWRLRLSFATDVARAVAYLHARQCIHRDLKGENLLITSNERVKVTDFGFARIASRNAEEMRRMTYCGTDGYMSPEIINGLEFDLPTDVFSLGIIFIEILSRKLVDSRTYTRTAPSFTPDPAEVRRRTTPGCPADLVDLALQCCLEEPTARPLMSEVLSRLREIEREVLSRTDESAEHVGSIRLVNHGGKRAMPSFDPPEAGVKEETGHEPREGEQEGEEAARKMEEEALDTLAKLDLEGGGASILDSEGGTWRTARWDEGLFSAMKGSELQGHQRLLPSSDTSSSLGSNPDSASAYSTDVIRTKPLETASVLKMAEPYDDAGSTMTVKGAPTVIKPAPEATVEHTGKDGKLLTRHEMEKERKEKEKETGRAEGGVGGEDAMGESQIGTIPSLASSEIVASATEKEGDKEANSGGGGTHRFTLVDKDAVPLINGKKVSAFASNFAFAFLRTQLEQLAPTTVKCPVCTRRLGQRPALSCDDCNVLVHVKCSHAAPRNCVGGDGAAMGK